MNRDEFSKLMESARISEGLNLSEVSRKVGCSIVQIKRMERSQNNFAIDNVFKHLNAVGVRIVVTNDDLNKKYIIDDREKLKFAFKRIRQLTGLTRPQAARKAGIFSETLGRVEDEGANILIETFLQYIHEFGYKIELIKKKNDSKEQDL